MKTAQKIKGTAQMRVNLEFDGTALDLVQLVEEIFGMLDSPDIGDAMGVLIKHTIYNDGEFQCEWNGMTLETSVDYDLFEWEGVE